MSMGYIPKKKLYVRRQRKLRKKYKNFSCKTCAKTHDWSECGTLCSHRYELTQPFGMVVSNVQNCKYWKASSVAKMNSTAKVIKNKPKLRTKIKDFLENIF